MGRAADGVVPNFPIGSHFWRCCCCCCWASKTSLPAHTQLTRNIWILINLLIKTRQRQKHKVMWLTQIEFGTFKIPPYEKMGAKFEWHHLLWKGFQFQELTNPLFIQDLYILYIPNVHGGQCNHTRGLWFSQTRDSIYITCPCYGDGPATLFTHTPLSLNR
jgi:hypothetical protein